jgi:peptidoglycan/LPS O-acetylase OafA/YrhL
MTLSRQAAEAAYQSYCERSHFANLDGLRFICIFMVVWHHNPPVSKEVFSLFGRGFLGVDFFFVLSGFLITTLLLRESRATGSFSLRNFYIRRALRILPVYYFVVTCVGIYYIFIKGRTELLELWPYYYLFLANFLTENIPLLTITWSLSVEEQYYMIWPLIMLLVPVRYLWLICVFLIALNLATIMGVFGVTPPTVGPLRLWPPNATYAPIIMGSLAAILLDNRQGFAALYQLASRYTTALWGVLLLAVLMATLPSDLRGLPNFALHATMTFILVALVVREETVMTPFLVHPVIARVGIVSYGMYLYHLIALDIVTRAGQMLFGGLDPWAVFILYFIVAYLMAELSFRTLEAWFRRFRPKAANPRTRTA